jgi:O-antigen biosynthesis protein
MKEINSKIKFLKDLVNDIGGIAPTLNKTFRFVARQGLRGAVNKAKYILFHAGIYSGRDEKRMIYYNWINKYDKKTVEEINNLRNAVESLPRKPVISVVMPTYNAKQSWLKAAIESVRKQVYPYWELCIADDASTDAACIRLLKNYQELDNRIKVVFRKENGHISLASNSAIAISSGEWIALMDHDDLIPEDALFTVAKTINSHPDAKLIYSDEDKIDDKGRRFDPYFKCDWNYHLFLSQNMISHLGVYHAATLKKTGGFRAGFEGSQDYDLALRFIEQINPEQIIHIPQVLYYWRAHAESTAENIKRKPYAQLAAQKAISEHLERKKISASVEISSTSMYRIKYNLPDELPLVSIIIPTRNNKYYLKKCISSITKKTNYPNYELIVVNNNSDDPGTLKYLSSLQENKKVTVLDDNRTFNFSTINNRASEHARGNLICFLNDDTEVINPDWLHEMVRLILQPEIAVVGAKLWYGDKTIQHAGVILGMGGIASHSHKCMSEFDVGYFGRVNIIQEFSAVTAACMLIEKDIFVRAGKFDEVNLAINYNDIDLCLKVKKLGYKIVWTPYAELYHHESKSRGQDNDPEKKKRFESEIAFMQKKWGELLNNDPAYSPNLTLDAENFGLAFPPRNKYHSI